MAKYTKKELDNLRNYSVIKSNDMILKSRFNLSVQEQRIVLYLVSKIQKDDTEFTKYPFSIQEFGEICGINTSGRTYKEIKDILKNLSNNSFWAFIDDDNESLLRWVDKVNINHKSGTISIRLHEDMIPFLLQLKGQYLDYKLVSVLAMKSQYGIRIYEILKAEYNRKYKNYTTRSEKVAIIDFDTFELKQKTNTENTYDKFNDFKKRVLEPAKNDINTYSDLMIEYEPLKESRTFKSIRFFVRYKKTVPEGLEQWKKVEQELNGRRKALPKIPSGSFCNNCEHLKNDICDTYPNCAMCTDKIEGQISLLK